MAFVFVKKGDNIRLFPPMPSSGIDRLPPKIYKIRMDDDGIFLEPVADSYVLPKKIYTDRIKNNADLIISSYTLDSTTGALMTGSPGSGKSLTTEMVCNEMLLNGIPVIWVSSYISVDLLRTVVSGIGPCVINFEEFSKSYDMGSVSMPFNNQQRRSRDDLNTQMDLLSFFSDTTLSGVMFLLSENDHTTISPFILCRPGRIKYHFRYTFDTVEILNEMVKDLEIQLDVLDYARAYVRASSQCNIDVIKSIVEVMKTSTEVSVFADRISSLNVPSPVTSRIMVVSVVDNETKEQQPFCVNIEGGQTFSNVFKPGSEKADLVIQTKESDQVVIPLDITKFKEAVPKENRFKEYVGYKIDIGAYTVFFRLSQGQTQNDDFKDMVFMDLQFTKATADQAVGDVAKKQYIAPLPASIPPWSQPEDIPFRKSSY